MSELDDLLKQNELFALIKATEEFLNHTIDSDSLKNKKANERIKFKDENVFIHVSYGYFGLRVNAFDQTSNYKGFGLPVISLNYNGHRKDKVNTQTRVGINDSYQLINLEESTYIKNLERLVKILFAQVDELVLKYVQEEKEKHKKIMEADPIKRLRSSNLTQLFNEKKTH